MKSFAQRLLLLAITVLIGSIAVISGCAAADTPDISPSSTSAIKHVSPAEAHGLIQENRDNPDFVILDVRTPGEVATGYIEGAINIDFYLETFQDEVDKLEKDKTYLVYCRTGNRSGSASQIMEDLGFKDIYNMTGGITEWHELGFLVVE